jgi:bacterioferritin
MPIRRSKPFQVDLETIRRRARERMDHAADTDAYTADRQQVVAVLNEALATEIVCVLRYKSHAYAARGFDGKTAAAEFLEHAAEEQAHADAIADRIDRLGGVPNLDPEGMLSRSHSEYRSGGNLRELLREDLIAERIAIETYTEIVRWLGDDDPVSRRLMEEILKKEEEHADDLSKLLDVA